MKKTVKPSVSTKKPARRAAIRRTEPQTSAPTPASPCDQIIAQMAELKKMVEALAPRPVAPEAALESYVDSLRRLLAELIEARQDGVVVRLAAVRTLAVSAKADPRVLAAMDGLLEELGAAPFQAQRLDFADPLIHKVVEERTDPAAPDGVVLETLQPGFRTGRGMVVAKASVAVNRRA
jgi:hypothetical protein